MPDGRRKIGTASRLKHMGDEQVNHRHPASQRISLRESALIIMQMSLPTASLLVILYHNT